MGGKGVEKAYWHRILRALTGRPEGAAPSARLSRIAWTRATRRFCSSASFSTPSDQYSTPWILWVVDEPSFRGISPRSQLPSEWREAAAYVQRADIHPTATPIPHLKFVRGCSAARVVFVRHECVRRECDAQPRKVPEKRHFSKMRQRCSRIVASKSGRNALCTCA